MNSTLALLTFRFGRPRLIQTIAELFYKAIAHDLPDALAHKQHGKFRPVSHRELQVKVECLALAMRAKGLRPWDRVAILSENRPEWAMVDYACAITGLPSVPVYPTLNPAQTEFILKDSGARWIFCSTHDQLAKVLSRWQELPELELAVLLGGDPKDHEGRQVLTWEQLMTAGTALEARRHEVRAWANERQPSDLLTIIYTSGTTGDPKGAMLSHGNLVSNILDVLKVLTPHKGEHCLSVLPLSHIYERTAGHYIMFHCGVSIYYTQNHMTIAQDLQETHPEIFLAVPRIFEKVYSRVRDTALAGGLVKRAVLGWAMRVGHVLAGHHFRGEKPGPWLRLRSVIADRLVFSKVRVRTGGRIRLAISGGAALNPKVNEFFWSLGVPIYEGYGLTETSPILTLNGQGKVKPGSVGHPILKEWEGKPFLKLAEDGEILVRGPNVMVGYWNNEAATREVMDVEGYFHTGDVGEWDEAERLKITDRKKEILVTSGGKNIAPQPIENLLRADKYIEQAVVIGDRQSYIAAIILPHFPALRLWATHKHLKFKDEEDLITLSEVQAKMKRQVGHTNTRLAKYERVRKIILIAQEMTPESGLLTPSLKIKRRIVDEVFKERIDALYKANGNGAIED
jgi:long-chain acyl-CoA synthetase